MPSQKEIQWSQLRVGLLILAGTAVLILTIFLMSGSSGGPFSRKLILRSYFDNASGLKNGAPVTLEGVTVGSVIRIRVVPERNPTPVEVTMRISRQYLQDLHTTSTTSIAQAGVLGDSYVDIDSSTATGPPPGDNAELMATGSPNIQDVIRTSQVSIEEVTKLIRKLQVLSDTLNSKRGTVGALINDPAFYAKVSRIADNLEKISDSISQGNGTLGKLVMDDTLYNRVNSATAHINNIATSLDEGRGSAGKLLRDESFYDNLNSSVKNINQVMTEVNQGKGSFGKLAKDPEFAQKLDDAIGRLDNILKGIDQGKGTLGQLAQNRALYDHANQSMDEAQQLLKGIRDNPKKYLVIRLKIF